MKITWRRLSKLRNSSETIIYDNSKTEEYEEKKKTSIPFNYHFSDQYRKRISTWIIGWPKLRSHDEDHNWYHQRWLLLPYLYTHWPPEVLYATEIDLPRTHFRTRVDHDLFDSDRSTSNRAFDFSNLSQTNDPPFWVEVPYTTEVTIFMINDMSGDFAEILNIII